MESVPFELLPKSDNRFDRSYWWKPGQWTGISEGELDKDGGFYVMAVPRDYIGVKTCGISGVDRYPHAHPDFHDWCQETLKAPWSPRITTHSSFIVLSSEADVIVFVLKWTE